MRFSDNVDEKHISDEEDQEAECEAMEPGDDGATIVAGATMEDLIRQLEPGMATADHARVPWRPLGVGPVTLR